MFAEYIRPSQSPWQSMMRSERCKTGCRPAYHLLCVFICLKGTNCVGKKAKLLWMIKLCILPVCHAMKRGTFLFVEIRRDIRLLPSLCSTKDYWDLKTLKKILCQPFPQIVRLNVVFDRPSQFVKQDSRV